MSQVDLSLGYTGGDTTATIRAYDRGFNLINTSDTFPSAPGKLLYNQYVPSSDSGYSLDLVHATAGNQIVLRGETRDARGSSTQYSALNVVQNAGGGIERPASRALAQWRYRPRLRRGQHARDDRLAIDGGCQCDRLSHHFIDGANALERRRHPYGRRTSEHSTWMPCGAIDFSAANHYARVTSDVDKFLIGERLTDVPNYNVGVGYTGGGPLVGTIRVIFVGPAWADDKNTSYLRQAAVVDASLSQQTQWGALILGLSNATNDVFLSSPDRLSPPENAWFRISTRRPGQSAPRCRRRRVAHR